MHIENILNQIHILPETSMGKLKQCIEEVAYPKGYILLRAQKVEDYLYFIKKGCVRAFAPLEEKDITFWFGEEGETILSMKSYVESKKAYENIELIEDCELYKLRIETLQELYNEDIHIANWGRRLAEKELLKVESRIIASELLAAKERYDDLLLHSPSLLQRVPLKYIASYLGITQVSLSRIRKVK
ncbi:Crp/Fnr family transcriptional regulator [Myroides injenensis]|uniref:Crp/Fnr family transcriptional regulator n=1 Tax=Myroides injenensis TaxID=1183151 RepID=UPI00226FB2ED|nr:Crp/Fnr family transcriptional regulator [Myroides injenensis]